MARVMVIDDEAVLLDMLAALIEELGHQPVLAHNGRQALAQLLEADELPALIVSDVMMPRMSGIDFARAVREDARLRHIPIILMSAAQSPGSRPVADHFVHKPFDLDVIATLIEHYLGK